MRSYKDRLLEVERLSGDLTKRTVALQEIERDLNRAQAVARLANLDVREVHVLLLENAHDPQPT